MELNSRSFLETNFSNGKKYICIPRSFLAINVCNQGKTLCSPCIFITSIKIQAGIKTTSRAAIFFCIHTRQNF